MQLVDKSVVEAKLVVEPPTSRVDHAIRGDELVHLHGSHSTILRRAEAILAASRAGSNADRIGDPAVTTAAT